MRLECSVKRDSSSPDFLLLCFFVMNWSSRSSRITFFPLFWHFLSQTFQCYFTLLVWTRLSCTCSYLHWQAESVRKELLLRIKFVKVTDKYCLVTNYFFSNWLPGTVWSPTTLHPMEQKQNTSWSQLKALRRRTLF